MFIYKIQKKNPICHLPNIKHTHPHMSLDNISCLPKDVIVLIAKFVYGDERVVVRKDGYVSFRILDLATVSFYTIPTFDVFIKTDNRTGLSSIHSKILKFRQFKIESTDKGWEDMDTRDPYSDYCPHYRKKQYTIRITYDSISGTPKNEFVVTTTLPCYSENSHIQREIQKKKTIQYK